MNFKFAIFREVEKDGKKQRKVYVEWGQTEIIMEIEKELEGAGQALVNVIEKCKKLSITIP